MRIPVFAANWKMHKTIAETEEFIAEFARMPLKPGTRELIIAPSFTSLPAAVNATRGGGIRIAAQNCHYEAKGAFTGEVSAEQIRSLGAGAVIIGHSERRHIFGETDALINRKLAAALGVGLTPILCVGELLEEREKNLTEEVLIRQVMEGMDGFSGEDVYRFIIAYEPVWAIGTGRTATPEIAQEAHLFLRGLLAERFGGPVAEGMRILYGGSVKPDNVAGLMAQADIDGALIGGASLDPTSFAGIINGA